MAQVDRFSVTMPPELGERVRLAAAGQGTSESTWLPEAAACPFSAAAVATPIGLPIGV